MSIAVSRRDFIGAMAASGAYAVLPRGVSFAADDAGCGLPVPSAAQRAWADMELGMFFHFDIPVYRPRWNWRTFKNFPDPKLYNPVKLDTDQWMESAKAYGAWAATETVGINVYNWRKLAKYSAALRRF